MNKELGHSIVDDNLSGNIGQVVVVLPNVGRRVLMQLRDDIPEIPFPNMWGFFGGTIESGESPYEAGKREIHEEIGLQEDNLLYLGANFVPEVGHTSHAFFCPLLVPLSNLKLDEGQDMALLSLEEILSGKFKSPGNGREFKVVSVPYISDSVCRMLDVIDQQEP